MEIVDHQIELSRIVRYFGEICQRLYEWMHWERGSLIGIKEQSYCNVIVNGEKVGNVNEFRCLGMINIAGHGKAEFEFQVMKGKRVERWSECRYNGVNCGIWK